MSDVTKDSSTKPAVEIRIVGLNTDKTRKTLGSYTVYQVYLELSESPPWGWKDIFGREWKNLNPDEEAIIDGKFLVFPSELQEIGSKHLPALKKAVEATNLAYKQYAREQLTEEERKADVWKQEREVVEDMARSLKF